MSTVITIIIAAVLTNNFVLSKFYGCCPFLGVSKKLDSSIGMGAAVVFVMVCAALVTYPIVRAKRPDLSAYSCLYSGHCRICTAAGNDYQKNDAAAL
mgnify:CR=1 FL=1